MTAVRAAFRVPVKAAKAPSFAQLADKINTIGGESRERWLAFNSSLLTCFSPLWPPQTIRMLLSAQGLRSECSGVYTESIAHKATNNGSM
jgi:hypothetical protein